MEKMGFKPPQVTLLTSRLRRYVPSKRLPLTLEEGIDLLRKVLRDKIKVKVAQIRPQPLPEAKERKGEEIIRIENLWHV